MVGMYCTCTAGRDLKQSRQCHKGATHGVHDVVGQIALRFRNLQNMSDDVRRQAFVSQAASWKSSLCHVSHCMTDKTANATSTATHIACNATTVSVAQMRQHQSSFLHWQG
jgi:hypothetical protein